MIEMTNEQKWERLCELLKFPTSFNYKNNKYFVSASQPDTKYWANVDKYIYCIAMEYDNPPIFFTIADLDEVEKIFAEEVEVNEQKPEYKVFDNISSPPILVYREASKEEKQWVHDENKDIWKRKEKEEDDIEKRKKEFEAMFPVGKKFNIGPFENEVISIPDNLGDIKIKRLNSVRKGIFSYLLFKDFDLWKAYFEKEKEKIFTGWNIHGTDAFPYIRNSIKKYYKGPYFATIEERKNKEYEKGVMDFYDRYLPNILPKPYYTCICRTRLREQFVAIKDELLKENGGE